MFVCPLLRLSSFCVWFTIGLATRVRQSGSPSEVHVGCPDHIGDCSGLPARNDASHTAESNFAVSSFLGDGDFDGIFQLLKERANPNVTDVLGETPLFEAAVSGNEPITALLLLARADPCHRSHAGSVARDMAESENVKYLLDAFNLGSAEDAKAAVLDALDPQVVEQLLVCTYLASIEHRDVHGVVDASKASALAAYDYIEVDGSEEPELSVAVREGSFELVRRLLQQKADPNCLDILKEPPLFEASAGGNVSMACALLLARADPFHSNPGGGVALELASERPMRALLQLATGVLVDDGRLSTMVLKQLPDQLKAPMTNHLKQCDPRLTETQPAAEAQTPDTSIAASHRKSLAPVPETRAPVAPAIVSQRESVAPKASPGSQNKASLSERLANVSRKKMLDAHAEEDTDEDVRAVRSDNSDSDCDDGFVKLLSPELATPVEVVDVELVVKKAVGDLEVKIDCRSDTTFKEVKDVLAKRLGRPDLRPRIWLVHRSESGAYVSYQDADFVGGVREVLFLAPTMTSEE